MGGFNVILKAIIITMIESQYLTLTPDISHML